jgi:hypothetical protein
MFMYDFSEKMFGHNWLFKQLKTQYNIMLKNKLLEYKLKLWCVFWFWKDITLSI